MQDLQFGSVQSHAGSMPHACCCKLSGHSWPRPLLAVLKLGLLKDSDSLETADFRADTAGSSTQYLAEGKGVTLSCWKPPKVAHSVGRSDSSEGLASRHSDVRRGQVEFRPQSAGRGPSNAFPDRFLQAEGSRLRQCFGKSTGMLIQRMVQEPGIAGYRLRMHLQRYRQRE